MNADTVLVGGLEVADYELSKVWGEAFADPRTPAGWNGRLTVVQAAALAQSAYRLGFYELAKAAAAGALVKRADGRAWAWASRAEALAADVSAYLGGVN